MKPTLTSLLCIFSAFIIHAQKIQPDQYFPIFEESFENNNKNWKTLQDNDGLGIIENGTLQLACVADEAACTQWIPNLEINTNLNFNISLETTWIDGNTDATYELEWGIDEDDTHSFSFGITADGKFQYSVFVNDEWKYIVPLTTSSAIHQKGKNKIGIQKKQEKIVFYVNDQIVHEDRFQDFFGQKMSLVIWGKQLVHFDQISIGYLENAKALIQNMVQGIVNQWQKKGEFEKSSDYSIRVNEETKQKKIIEAQTSAINHFKKLYAGNFSFQDFKLGNYDADHETYLIQSNRYGNFVISVPINDATFVKNNFQSFAFRNPDFYIKNNQFELSHFELLGGNNYRLFYDSKDELVYKNSIIEYHFEEISLDIQNENNYPKNKVFQENITYGKSDVDINIPVSDNSQKQEKTFAVVIGNELYNKEIKVDYALNDARIFKQYLEKTIGIPSDNVHMLENGTYGQILDALKWISDITKAFKGEAKVIFYYAGHGVPDEQTKGAFILPVDGNAQNTLTAIKLDEVYRQLSTHPTISTIVFLDACFSGAARAENEMLAEGRGVKIKPKSETLSGNLIVLSAATGDETALPYAEKQHGIFTYYLLKKMQETKGNVQVKDLAEYINTQVSQQSLIVNKKSQTPQVNVSTSFANDWTKLKLK